jgi:hypothetical protein
MVIVLVPTGTPFSADRQLAAERHHFGQANHNSFRQCYRLPICIGLLLPPMTAHGKVFEVG